MRLPELAQKYIKKLEIQWPVKLKKGDTLLLQTEADPRRGRKGTHIIFAPESCFRNADECRVELAHELCRGWLAENIDLIFGNFRVQSPGNLEQKEAEYRILILSFATFHEGLLVNDVRDKILGRELTLEDCQRFQEELIFFVKKAKENPRLKYLVQPEFFWQIALNIAMDKRYQLELGAEKVLDLFDNDTRQHIKKIVEIYNQLPLLRWDEEKEKILLTFERSVQRISEEVLEANFLPKMVDHPDYPGRKIWSVE